MTIRDLCDLDAQLEDWTGFHNKYPTIVWIEWMSVIKTIPPMWKVFLNRDQHGAPHKELFAELSELSHVNRCVYNKIIYDDNHIFRYLKDWHVEIPDIELDWFMKSFQRLYRMVKSSKLRDFQYRLNLHKIVAQSDLFTWGKVDHNRCTMCDRTQETVTHLLVTCPKITEVYKTLENRLKNKDCEFNVKNIIFNYVHRNPYHISNYLCTIVKQFIYRSKCLKVTITKETIFSEIEHVFNMELFNCNFNTERKRKLILRWMEYKPEIIEHEHNQN